MKDPFALLSIRCVSETTGAVPVLVYRHPGAVLASYRRMGWDPDLSELREVLANVRSVERLRVAPLPSSVDSFAEAIGIFWSTLHQIAIADMDRLPDAVVVSHADIAQAGVVGAARLFERLRLRWNDGAESELTRTSTQSGKSTRLHNLDRSPATVASDWYGKVSLEEISAVENATASVRADLEARKLDLSNQRS